ncbi:kelch-like protein [Archangium gephyra]|uniref:Kelch repeat-containing protein n=1 Tax=Archangium gephyra TaxID=48 RepID=UPI0035D42F26
MSKTLLFLAAGLWLATTGCTPEPTTGSARVLASFQQAASASGVTRVTLTVTGPDMEPLGLPLEKTDDLWGGTLSGIPAGAERVFTAEAFDAAGTKLFAGMAPGVTITAGGTALVAITLQELEPPPPFENSIPSIDSLTASASRVEPGGMLTLQATAHDPDPGDTLTVSWETWAGSFGSPASLTTTWTAPTFPATVTLRLKVTDSRGATATLDFNVTVTSGTGLADVSLTLNAWPRVSSMNASPYRVDVGETLTAEAAVTDANGDTPTYAWTAGCAGTWTEATSRSARFTPTTRPAGSGCGSCPLTVSVSDGRGGRSTGTLHVCVGPRVAARFAPDVVGTYQSADSLPDDGNVVLRVSAADSQGSALTFAWTASAGEVSAPVSTATSSEVVWTAPGGLPEGSTATLTASVTNALGLSTTATFRITGAATGPGSWASTGSLATIRGDHSATLLPSGKVLVAGGSYFSGGKSTYLSSAELYDPTTGTWSPTGSMAVGRRYHAATLLASGKVLVVGGEGSTGALGSAELYDPATGTWTSAGSMAVSRQYHTSVKLPSGKVLVLGGISGGVTQSSAELYDPETSTWSSAGKMSAGRGYTTATLLPSGKVLVAGGIEGGTTTHASAELYDPATGTWSATGSMLSARRFHFAVLLPSGKVLVGGGHGSSFELAAAELYDPATGKWTATGSMSTRRAVQAAALLTSGKVLVTGGSSDSSTYLTTAERYDPATGTWTPVGNMASPRRWHTLTRLASGKVLVTAGLYQSGGYLSSAELYTP